MKAFKVFLFGPPRFELDGSIVSIQERKAIALWIYLALIGAHHSRDELATMFWPKQSQARARAALRHAIWSLRVAGLGDWIFLEGDQLGIRSTPWLDVAEFSHRIDQVRHHGCVPEGSCPACQNLLAEAVALYRDDLLTGFTLRDAPRFDEWQYDQGEHLRHELAYGLSRLVTCKSLNSAWSQAIQYSRRWVAIDPLNETAQRGLMWIYSSSGKRSRALSQFDNLKTALREELGVAPEAETLSLAEAIRSSELLMRFSELAAGSQAFLRNANEPPGHLLERGNFLDRLTRLLKEVSLGRGRMVFLSAEAGGGKTTLIRHFCAAVRESATVYEGKCDPLSTPQPFGPLWDIAFELGGDLLQTLESGDNPERILRAFLEILRSKAMAQIVVLEDVHWGDDATFDLLKYIGRRIESTRALVIVSFRDDGLERQHPLRILLGDLATSTGLERMHLPPLSRQAVEVFVSGSGLDPGEVFRKTGGNPYFIHEMLASGVNELPDHARDAIWARLARLSKPASAFLDAAAVVGPRAGIALLDKMTGANAATVEACLSVGILLAQGDVLAFRHELAWQAVLEAISPPRLMVLHRQALEALKASTRGAGDFSRLAHHAEAAADAQAVLTFAPMAARQAAAAGAHRQAAAQYERALRFSSSLPPQERAELLQAYAHECHLNDRNDQALQALDAARQIWKDGGEPLKEGDNLSRRAASLLFSGMRAEADRTIRSAIEILSALPASPELAYAYSQYARVLTFSSDFPEAISMAQKSIPIAERFKDFHTLIRAQNTIGISLIYMDDPGGIAHLERSIALAREVQDDAGVARGYVNLGRWTGLMFGWNESNRYIDEGLAHCAEHELDFDYYFLLASQASAYLHQGRWSEAEANAKRILSRQNLSIDTHFWALIVLGRIRILRGDAGGSAMLDEALKQAEKFGNLTFLGPVRAARAEAAWLAGRLDLVRKEILSIYDQAVVKRHKWYTGELSLWLWRAGQKVDPPEWALPVFGLQMRGDWAAAAGEWARRGQPYERAWALADGDRQAQTTALEIFEQLGAAPAVACLQRRIDQG